MIDSTTKMKRKTKFRIIILELRLTGTERLKICAETKYFVSEINNCTFIGNTRTKYNKSVVKVSSAEIIILLGYFFIMSYNRLPAYYMYWFDRNFRKCRI